MNTAYDVDSAPKSTNTSLAPALTALSDAQLNFSSHDAFSLSSSRDIPTQSLNNLHRTKYISDMSESVAIYCHVCYRWRNLTW